MERMSSIEMALMNERTEMRFYRSEAKRSKNPLAKAMFEALAKDELEHMTRIDGLHRALVTQGAWPVDLPLEVQGTQIRQILNETVAKSGSREDHDLDDQQAIEKAIEFEGRGERFYKELSGVCESPAEGTFFTFLSQIEREHRLSLLDSLAYLKNPELWLAEHERAGLDGA